RDPAHPLELRLDIGGLERRGAARRVVKVERRGFGSQSLDRIDEAEKPRPAAKLAVGDRLQADLLLQPDRLPDAAVLHRAKRRLDHAAGVEFAKGIFQLLRPQHAPDMLGPERRTVIARRHLAQPRLSTKRAALMLASNSLPMVPGSRK